MDLRRVSVGLSHGFALFVSLLIVSLCVALPHCVTVLGSLLLRHSLFIYLTVTFCVTLSHYVALFGSVSLCRFVSLCLNVALCTTLSHCLAL